MGKKKVSFLFGAGAEKDIFNLPIGISFMRNSYLNKEQYEEQSIILSGKFDGKYFKKINEDENNYYEYSKYNYADQNTIRSIMKKWIFNQFYEQDINETYEKQLYYVLNKDDLRELFKEKYNPEFNVTTNEMKNNNSGNENPPNFLKIFEDLINCEDITESDMVILKDTFLENFLDGLQFKKELPTGISFILDKHFHTIIDPKKFGINNFSKVFNYYWSIFFAIYRPLLDMLDIIYLEKNTEELKGLSYNSSVDNLAENINLLYNDAKTWEKVTNIAKGSYYQVINDTFNKSSSSVEICGVITSNYYKLIELVETSPSNMYAYLNGKLSLFEIPETLEVLDITKHELPKDKLYFPFVLGQSYTKPIVSKHQIDAFSNMSKILDVSDILVIIGYNINEDDNHINSFIRNFVTKKNKHIIIISSDDNKSEIQNKLKLEKNSNIIILKANYKKESISDIIKRLKERIDKI